MELGSKKQNNSSSRLEGLRSPSITAVTGIEKCLEEIKKSLNKKGSLAAIWDEWPKLAGPQLAKNCRPLNLYRGILIIGASHPQWRQALQYNRPQLLASLKSAGHQIKEIRIKQDHSNQKQNLESQKSLWENHPSRVDIHGLGKCVACGNPSSTGEIKLWGKCSFCRRQELAN